MKRFGNLWEQIISKENIRLAVKRACKSTCNKTPSKTRHIKYVKKHFEQVVDDIHELLVSGKYKTSKYYVYPLYEPKLRFIYCLPFYPDRIIHHCIMNVLAPIWDKMMHTESYACRVGYGQHKAGTLCGQYAKKYKYVAQFDISQFYISIEHNLLKQVIRRKIKDKILLAVLDEIIDSISTRDKNIIMLRALKKKGNTSKDVDIGLEKLLRSKAMGNKARAGLPIGNFTSQWFGNIFMHELDDYVKHELSVKPYIRYCDDFLIFSNNKAELNAICAKIKDFLWNRLHLMLSKCEVYSTTQGIDFTGYRYFHNGLVLVRKRVATKQRRTLKHLLVKLICESKMNYEFARSQLASMWGILKWAKTYNFRQAFRFEYILKEVTALAAV